MQWHATSGVLNMFVIYERPNDFPESFVVRRFELDQATAEHCIAPTLAQARAALPPLLSVLPRQPEDDPKIVEVWF